MDYISFSYVPMSQTMNDAMKILTAIMFKTLSELSKTHATF